MDQPPNEPKPTPSPSPAAPPATPPAETLPPMATPPAEPEPVNGSTDDAADLSGETAETDSQDIPVEQAESPLSAREADAAHSKTQQQFKLVEVISIALLVFLALAALAGWAYYNQNDDQSGSNPLTTGTYE